MIGKKFKNTDKIKLIINIIIKKKFQWHRVDENNFYAINKCFYIIININ